MFFVNTLFCLTELEVIIFIPSSPLWSTKFLTNKSIAVLLLLTTLMLLPIKFPLLSIVNAALTGTEILIILAGTSPASFFIFPF